MDVPLPHDPQPQGMVAKNFLHLRGLPYDAKMKTIVELLGQHVFAIDNNGVHMVYDDFGLPSGEAFIRMESEESAYLAALECHGRYLMGTKKLHYVEVFQCSVDGMQNVNTSVGPPASGGHAGASRVPVVQPLPAAATPPPPALQSSYALPSVALLPSPSPPMSPATHNQKEGVMMVLVHGLPCSASVHHILELFQGFPELTPECVNIQRGADGCPNGKAVVVFPRQVEARRVVEELRRQNIDIELLFTA